MPYFQVPKPSLPLACVLLVMLVSLGACSGALQSNHGAKAALNTPQGHVVIKGKPVYLSGFNVAWFDFARDFGKGVDEKALRKALQQVKDSGGNSLRWWMHTDGSQTPEWHTVNGVRLVAGPWVAYTRLKNRVRYCRRIRCVHCALYLVVRYA